MNDEGRKQQSKLRELAVIASKLDCTLAQLAIGKFLWDTNFEFLENLSSAWCLKNENVHCVLLGASSVEQLYENINSLQV